MESPTQGDKPAQMQPDVEYLVIDEYCKRCNGARHGDDCEWCGGTGIARKRKLLSEVLDPRGR